MDDQTDQTDNDVNDDERPVNAFADDALGDLDAVGVAERIRSGEVSAAEVTEAAIARVMAVNPTLNAVAFEAFDGARAQAYDIAAGSDLPFAGVPSFVKDNNDVAGMPTRFGSAAMAAHPAKRSYPSAAQFLAQGYVVLGKSSMPEFGMTATTEFVDAPPTRNAWNPAHSSGASSGGSAALVASGAVPIAHANDGGGSIRIPAAANGLVGLKTTRGRTLDQPGARLLPINPSSELVVSRTVRDTAYHLAAMERVYRNRRLPEVGLVTGAESRRLRIGVARVSPSGSPVDANTMADLNATIALLSDMGHQIDETELPSGPAFVEDFKLYWGLLATLMTFSTRLAHWRYFDPSKLDPVTRGLRDLWSSNKWRSITAIFRLRSKISTYDQMFENYDVVLSPTLNHRAPRIGFLAPEQGFDGVFAKLQEYVGFTPVNNICGGPAISLPTPLGDDGLPGAVQFSAASGDERTLLSLAYELEEARPFPRIDRGR